MCLRTYLPRRLPLSERVPYSQRKPEVRFRATIENNIDNIPIDFNNLIEIYQGRFLMNVSKMGDQIDLGLGLKPCFDAAECNLVSRDNRIGSISSLINLKGDLLLKFFVSGNSVIITSDGLVARSYNNRMVLVSELWICTKQYTYSVIGTGYTIDNDGVWLNYTTTRSSIQS